MRVTQKILFGNFMRDISKNRAELGKIQSDLSSGRTVRFPSHDPISFQQSRVIGENIRKEEQYQRNISSGLRQARMAQDTLDKSIDRLVEIKGILVQGATGTTGESVRANMAEEIAGLRDTLVDTFNLSYGDRYLFAGTNSAVAPFENDELAVGGVESHSNTTAPNILAGDGVQVDISVTGTELRDTGSGDMFEVIQQIEDALLDDDTDALNGLLDDMDGLIDHATHLTSRLGGNINQMEFMFERYESSAIYQKSDISELVDTDYAQAFSDLQRTQVAFESAMAVHSTMFGNSLLDYL
ncbi:MAG: hypothetical protein WD355_02465 [Balneolaceae bacterium]